MSICMPWYIPKHPCVEMMSTPLRTNCCYDAYNAWWGAMLHTHREYPLGAWDYDKVCHQTGKLASRYSHSAHAKVFLILIQA